MIQPKQMEENHYESENEENIDSKEEMEESDVDSESDDNTDKE